MFMNSFSHKLFGVFGALLMTSNCFAWGPWDVGARIKKKYFPAIKKIFPFCKDPLFPFIHPEAKITIPQFNELLKNLSDEQRKDLWKALVASNEDPKQKITAEKLKNKLIWVSSSWWNSPFKNEADYHELVKWVAKKNGVQKAECDKATTFQLERRIMEKMFTKLWDKLTPEQKKKILKEAEFSPKDIAAYSALSAAALLTTMSAASAAMGFAFYIVAAKTVVVVAASVLGASAATTITVVSALCGPIGWCIAGITAVTGALLIGGPNATKTAAFIIALHSIKAKALEESGVDVSKYVLK